jgi:hypothetical protein
MWNKSYFIALLIIGCSFLGSLIVELIAFLMQGESKAMAVGIPHLSAYMIGQVYASKQRRLMPRTLRFRSTIYCCLWTYLTLIVFMRSINPSSFTFSTIPYGMPLFIIFLPPISSAFLYLAMGLGSKYYMKKMGI